MGNRQVDGASGESPQLERAAGGGAEAGHASELLDATSHDADAAPDEFTISFSEAPPTLGLELDLMDGITARVTEVLVLGAIPALNSNIAPEWQVMKGDHIVKVNDTFGSADKITQDSVVRALGRNSLEGGLNNKELSQGKALKIVVQRPKEFLISIGKIGGIGIEYTHASNGTSLLISKILSQGGIADWNASNQMLAVKEKDRIVQVNGIKGRWSELVKEILSAQRLNLCIHRCYAVGDPTSIAT
eukprot:gnl/TRDRNA2_/TRDRNA2_171405_c0_seq3.p1 gnl/TRDRNA2_/TRDRNA2_171405_c0~~gnl/TRDRNA2_/TRDRNA2_171405_c0_seq3.p1  ORF type:complete len:246 (+),score=48.50 gnl/TRDRNA2_/TRDRNA2_171405_c0_seq3:88-825(+)